MPLNSKPYYWVSCDRCGKSAQEDAEFSAYTDEETAIDSAHYEAEFAARSDNKAFACPDCEPYCRADGCLNDAGPYPGERDYLCKSCFDFQCVVHAASEET